MQSTSIIPFKGSVPSVPRTTHNSLTAGSERGRSRETVRGKRDLKKRIAEAEKQTAQLETSVETPAETPSETPARTSSTSLPVTLPFDTPEVSDLDLSHIRPLDIPSEILRRSLPSSPVTPFSPDIPQVDLSSTQIDNLQPNLQSEETISFTKMVGETKHRMVAPGTRDAPRFKASDPDELRRFIWRMEDLWDEAGIQDDEKKKETLGKYADVVSEEEWKELRTFEKGTWKEFKAELIANYPEAAAAARGTPRRIRQLCAETSKIKLGDLSALYRFKRAFLTEARKLQKPPHIMSNRELVELFVGCLSDALATAALQYLGNRGPDFKSKKGKAKSREEEPSSSEANRTENAEDKSSDRRPEDRYDLEDICAAAIEVSEDSQGLFDLLKKDSSRSRERDVFMFSQPISESKVLSEKVEEMEGVQALERDRLVSMNKMIETRINELENLIKSLVNHAKGDCRNSNCKMHEPNGNPLQKGGKTLENEKCFWCGIFGHFQADCEDLKTQIRIGNVKLNHEGKLRLKDGSFIPKYPADATLKERVERHYARKPSQLYYGEYEDSDPTPSSTNHILSQLLNTSNDVDRRMVTQLKAELELKKREEALELRQRKLDEIEKKSEQTSASTRAVNIHELLEQFTDEDLATLKNARSGFH